MKNDLSEMQFYEHPYALIRDTVGNRPAESGGILLGFRDDYIVRKFVFDDRGSCGAGGYDPDVDYLNGILKKEKLSTGYKLLGFVHSHPRGIRRLSGDYGNGTGDVGYLRRIFQAMPNLQYFLVPIVFTSIDCGTFSVLPFVASRNKPEDYWEVGLRVVCDPSDAESNVIAKQRRATMEDKNASIDGRDAILGGDAAPVVDKTGTPMEKEVDAGFATVPNTTDIALDLSRQQGAVDAVHMRSMRVLGVGAGGAAGLYEDLVRCGVGALTVMDFDSADRTNLATQGYDQAHVGMSKVSALEQRVRSIAPNMNYIGLSDNFLRISEDALDSLIPTVDLILMMTDDFHAQARGNLVALKYGKPAIFAMTYEAARCSEISFIIPGVTPACHRCAVASRYRNYEQGYVNDVRQQSSTVFATHYLNCCIGFIALAILHRHTAGLEFSNWFPAPWKKNFVQVRTHPQYSMGEGQLFRRHLGGTGVSVAFDSVWRSVEPRQEGCPDCGSVGDLTKVQKITSTVPRLRG